MSNVKIDKNAWEQKRANIQLKRGPKPSLNTQTLKTKKGKEYAEIVFLGDIHWGSPQCNRDKVRSMVEYCNENNIYILLMGDLLEFATKSSVGAGVYEQVMNPQQQYNDIIDLLQPLADKKLLLGLIRGNHELRGYKESGINISEIMASELNIPYLGDACWNYWKVGDENYVGYTLHGKTGSRYIHTKLNAAIKIAQNFDCEFLAMGHVHELASVANQKQKIDKRNKIVKTYKKFVILTGHYLDYGGYAQRGGMSAGKQGSPKMKLFSNKHDIHISK